MVGLRLPRSCLLRALVLVGAFASAGPASGVSLHLLSAGQVGSLVNVTIAVAGLGDFTAPSLRSYDVDVSYDPGLVSYVSTGFAALLGVPGSQALTAAGDLGTAVDVASVSLLSTATLHALQPESFALATLTFSVIGFGDAAFDFAAALLGDQAGAALAIDSSHGLLAPVAVVPEPSTSVLFAFGLLWLVGFRCARSSC
jgi:hypothetical protein